MLQKESLRNFIVAILIGLIGWDFLTTYYGTLSIFSDSTFGVWGKINATDFFIHLISVVFSIALIAFILAYRIIMSSKNRITTMILIVAFAYDFGTSFYGTSQAANISSTSDINVARLAIVFLLSVMCTAAPLLIGQVYEDSRN